MLNSMKDKIDKTIKFVNDNRGFICYGIGVTVGCTTTYFIMDREIEFLKFSRDILREEFNVMATQNELFFDFVEEQGLRGDVIDHIKSLSDQLDA